MSGRNVCAEDGWLVAARYPVPDAPYDYAFCGAPVIGCNQLACKRCGERVRQAPDLAPGRQAPDAAALHAAADWQALADGQALVRDAGARLYACGCAVHVESPYYRSIADPAGENALDPAPPGWACAGHPRLDPPLWLDGVDIGPHTDFDGFALASLAGQSPAQPPAFVADHRSCELERLYHLFAHVPLAEKISRGVAAGLVAGDPAVRSAAARFFALLPDAPGAEQVAIVARDRADDWRGVTDPFLKQHTLAEPLGQALGARLELSGSAEPVALSSAREVVRWPGRASPALLDALAARDREWLAAHGPEVLAATPGHRTLEDLLYVLAPALGDGIVDAALALWRTGAVDREAFVIVVEQLIEEPARGRILAAIGQ